MKKALFTFCFIASIFAVNAQTFHGKVIKANKKAIEANDLSEKMGEKTSVNARVTGVVEDVCQAKGCWMKVATENGSSMRVTFKDYAFFVPKDIAGKKVIFEGKAIKKETSIADLKHYAEDAGKSPAEIAKIINPEYSITFEAEGVIVEK